MPSPVDVHPQVVAMDDYEYVYVSDQVNDSIWKFDKYGALVNKWGA